LRPERSTTRRSALVAGFFLPLLLVAAPALAERAWVKDELRLNLRTGPGVQYRIVGVLQTGDAVQILSRGDGWTEVGPENTEKGWIPEGYLQPTPPARVALAEREAESADLEKRLAALTESESRLRTAHEEISSRDAEQQAEITRLTRENLELRAGARWPEWITGAGIVLVGMALGAIVARSSGRRRQQRIKL
jgi:SH3 domain protein